MSTQTAHKESLHSNDKNSRFYELVYLIRQDVSSVDLDRVNNETVSLLTSYGARVVKQEYWGLKSLAYEIKRNKKAHFMMFGIEIPNNECITELKRRMKQANEIIRDLLMRVKSIDSAPSGILKSFVVTENTSAVDVTIANSAKSSNQLNNSEKEDSSEVKSSSASEATEASA